MTRKQTIPTAKLLLTPQRFPLSNQIKSNRTKQNKVQTNVKIEKRMKLILQRLSTPKREIRGGESPNRKPNRSPGADVFRSRARKALDLR